MNLTNFRIGGMNITGFSMVNPNRESAQILMDKWEKLDPQQWPGAGTKSMSVSQFFLSVVHLHIASHQVTSPTWPVTFILLSSAVTSRISFRNIYTNFLATLSALFTISCTETVNYILNWLSYVSVWVYVTVLYSLTLVNIKQHRAVSKSHFSLLELYVQMIFAVRGGAGSGRCSGVHEGLHKYLRLW